jgi:hypothetical protein
VVREESEDGPDEGQHRDDEEDEDVVWRQEIIRVEAVDEPSQHSHCRNLSSDRILAIASSTNNRGAEVGLLARPRTRLEAGQRELTKVMISINRQKANSTAKSILTGDSLSRFLGVNALLKRKGWLVGRRLGRRRRRAGVVMRKDGSLSGFLYRPIAGCPTLLCRYVRNTKYFVCIYVNRCVFGGVGFYSGSENRIKVAGWSKLRPGRQPIRKSVAKITTQMKQPLSLVPDSRRTLPVCR